MAAPGQQLEFPRCVSLEHFEGRIEMIRKNVAPIGGALRLVLLLSLAAAGLCQSEIEPYFALFTTRTFGTDSKPSVQLSAWNVDSLEFRVYRIHDPLAFFEQLPDPHQFGGLAPRRPGEFTLIERIHDWKS